MTHVALEKTYVVKKLVNHYILFLKIVFFESLITTVLKDQDQDPDPGGPINYGSAGSGSTTLRDTNITENTEGTSTKGVGRPPPPSLSP